MGKIRISLLSLAGDLCRKCPNSAVMIPIGQTQNVTKGLAEFADEALSGTVQGAVSSCNNLRFAFGNGYCFDFTNRSGTGSHR